MDRKRILYLSSSVSSFNTSKFRNEYGVDSYPITKKKTFFCKLLIFLGYYFFTPLLYFVYGSWKYKIDNYDVVIVDTRRTSKYAVKLIKRHKKKLIMFYWNIISKKEINPNFLKKYTNFIYTFSLSDSIQYGIAFNDTCIYEKVLERHIATTDENVAYYLGSDKEGRNDLLKNLFLLLSNNGIKCDFHLVGNKNSEFCSRAFDYEEYLSQLAKSRYVVEIVSNGQTGLTLRSIEALYYGKKMITNNNQIRKFPFYDDSRIYIVGEGTDFNLFMKKEYKTVDKATFSYYYFEEWLSRLVGEKIS